MPEAPRIPIIRITRPYASEKEFIDADFGWVGRQTLILPGAPVRPSGELVRFEVVLANGVPILRGEGHVAGHNAPGGARPPGLEVRFTRVDAKSKLVLDRVRERRASFSSHTMAAATPSMLASLSASMLPVLQPPADVPSERSGIHLKRPGPVAPPPNREEILERLRVRARELAAAGGLAFKKS